MDKKISQLTTASTPLTGAEELAIVQSGVTKKTTIEDVKGYKVYTALLTQSGGDNQAGINWDDPNPMLTVGVTYTIQDNGGGLDMTNVGAPNNDINTSFVATGTTPNSWGEGVVIYNTGAPVVTVLENTIGNVWFTWNGDGTYSVKSNNLFPINKTMCFLASSFTGGAGDPNSNIIFYSQCPSENELVLYSVNSGTAVNDIISNTPIEIRVYN